MNTPATLRILFAGDVVGSPGRKVFKAAVARLREQENLDFIAVNGENAAGGRGLTRKLATELLDAGADVITLGDHTWDQRDLAADLPGLPRVIRPANFTPGCPGQGWVTLSTPRGKITIINLIGRVFMQPQECPFRKVDDILREVQGESQFVLVDFHAEATSEKIAMGWHLDGRVSAVVGTHTHVQTGDERILPKGTAYITDLGMTGPRDSVLGRDVNAVLSRFRTGMPTRFGVAGDETAHLEGVLIDLDPSTGRALDIRRVRCPLHED